MFIVVIPSQIVGRTIKVGVPHMKVFCIHCKLSAEIPEVILNAIAEAADETVESMVFVCDNCMKFKTETVAEQFINRTIYKNAHLN